MVSHKSSSDFLVERSLLLHPPTPHTLGTRNNEPVPTQHTYTHTNTHRRTRNKHTRKDTYWDTQHQTLFCLVLPTHLKFKEKDPPESCRILEVECWSWKRAPLAKDDVLSCFVYCLHFVDPTRFVYMSYTCFLNVPFKNTHVHVDELNLWVCAVP